MFSSVYNFFLASFNNEYIITQSGINEVILGSGN